MAVNPGSGFNSFWQMPFRKKFRMTMENRSGKPLTIYYQVDYSLTQVPANAAYFHAQFRLANRLKARGAAKGGAALSVLGRIRPRF